jgi:hypothetical protein
MGLLSGRGLAKALGGAARGASVALDEERKARILAARDDMLRKYQVEDREDQQAFTAEQNALNKVGGGKIGQYNPGDYTPSSFATFQETKDPSVLERYEAPQHVMIAGVPHVFDKGSGSYVRARVGDTAEEPEVSITAETVAKDTADIAGAKASAEIAAETAGALDQEFVKKLGSEGGAVYANLQKAAQDASAFIPRLESLADLASSVDTGFGAETKLLAKKAIGVDVASEEELNAKLGELAQDILNQQTGTKTDFDFQNAVRQSASLGKTKEANKRLIEALISRQEQAVRFGDLAKEAYDQGGVRAVLDLRYTPESEEVAPPPSIARTPEAPATLSIPKDASGAPRPETQAQYDAMPSGTVYIDPDDGKQYRKP